MKSRACEITFNTLTASDHTINLTYTTIYTKQICCVYIAGFYELIFTLCTLYSILEHLRLHYFMMFNATFHNYWTINSSRPADYWRSRQI
jgi:hypothetical protein